MIHTVLGVLMTITGIFDAIKYVWEAQAIMKVKTSKGHSRKFINAAIINDVVRIAYLLICPKLDYYLLISAFVAIGCMLYMYWQVYWFYPYRTYKNGKKPNLPLYIINSLLPNSIRKRL